MKVYILRHGQTNWNKQGKLQGQVNISLNSTGKEMARAMGKELKEIPFEIAYASPLNRAKQTAALILGERKVPLKTTPDLLEVAYGDCESSSVWADIHLPWMPMYRFFNDIEHYQPPHGGENMMQVRKRCRHFLNFLLNEEKRGVSTALAVTHGSLLRLLQAEFMGISEKEAFQIPEYPNCGGFILEIHDGIFKKAEFMKERL